MPLVGYRIYRDGRFSIDPNNPSAGLMFSPPADSDELFDELRTTYPDLKNHAQRKIRAIIDYLSTELEGAVEGPATARSHATKRSIPTPSFTGKTGVEHRRTSASSSDGQSSPVTSPESDSSPSMPKPTTDKGVTKHVPTNASSILLNPAVPAMEEMVSIWRTSDGSAPTRKRRRQMNERERGEYKRRRLAGACESCKMHKRKCTHQNRTDDDIPQPGKRRGRHTKKRKSPLATPGPEPKSPASSQTVQHRHSNSQVAHLAQTPDVSPTYLQQGDGATSSQDLAEQVLTETPLTDGGSLGAETNGQMTPPSDDENENDSENEAEVQSDDAKQSEYEIELQDDRYATTSSEEE
ncbi:uncharacterized protein BDZ99DRAFT_290883 [Mytilinidion resinicola]|uniref:Uncharacterized protein n=1 Tax=Mytilinidion resinicola TaxID=574789 RepID=A0A6A6YQ66_9PEZI|nr:uncharacterized protein BDZ99DRAFT_290883 [Mytilinidion resinicola]KAF2810901.1 hypothetical protein BDZ99DRAFT_290883 [Mytilinidion resinicola]